MKFVEFEWDAEKDVANVAKHGISFVEAQLAFCDEHGVLAEDAAHSDREPRYYWFGRIERGIVTVRFTIREQVVRILGAGFWRKGRVIYETENSLHR